jgi:hypothetical protein
MALDVEEVGAAEVLVAGGVVGVDGGGLDGDLDGGVLGALAHLHRPGQLGEAPAGLGQAQVLHLEAHGGVALIDGPGAGDGQLDAVDGADGGGGCGIGHCWLLYCGCTCCVSNHCRGRKLRTQLVARMAR